MPEQCNQKTDMFLVSDTNSSLLIQLIEIYTNTMLPNGDGYLSPASEIHFSQERQLAGQSPGTSISL